MSCCATTAAVTILCGCCGGPEVPLRRQWAVAKWFYLSIFVLSLTLTWVLRDYGPEWTAGNQSCDEAKQRRLTGEDDVIDTALLAICYGGEVPARISFANFSFFFLHFLVLLFCHSDNDIRIPVHSSCLLWKTLVWLGAVAGFFFVPVSVLEDYAQGARAGAGIFLVIELILLVELIYSINEWLVKKDSRFTWALLILGAGLSFVVGLALIGLAYHFYSPSPSCHLNNFYTTSILLGGLALVAILFIPNRAESAGLFTSGSVFGYCCWLLLSALGSEPLQEGDKCMRGTGTGQDWVLITGFVFVLCAIVYRTYSTGVASNDLFGGGKEEGDGELPYRADFFHLIFALASMYSAMLFSSWEVRPQSMNRFEVDKSWASTWVKMAAAWVCMLIYAWTVLAPAIFPDRDFSTMRV